MGAKRPNYTPEFRAEAVQLVRSSGKAVSQMAKCAVAAEHASCHIGDLVLLRGGVDGDT